MMTSFYVSRIFVDVMLGECLNYAAYCVLEEQNRSTEGCSRLKRSVDMTSSGKNGLNIRTHASPKWDRTRCPELYDITQFT